MSDQEIEEAIQFKRQELEAYIAMSKQIVTKIAREIGELLEIRERRENEKCVK